MMHGDGLPHRRLHVVQGSHSVSGEADVMMTTILGSCVAACLWDPMARVGGMNHFLLPEAPEGQVGDRRYGVQAMELLINGLLGLGARRERILGKLFGGARMTKGLVDIGARNAAFARKFLQDEGLQQVSESLGGEMARRIQFWPATGRARQHLVEPASVISQERALPPPRPAVSSGDLELF